MKIKAKISEIYEGVIGSLDNRKNKGFSARKITVLVVMVCIIFVHASWLKHAFLREDFEYMIEVLVIDSLFVLLLLGIVTMEQISKLRGGVKNDKTKVD